MNFHEYWTTQREWSAYPWIMPKSLKQFMGGYANSHRCSDSSCEATIYPLAKFRIVNIFLNQFPLQQPFWILLKNQSQVFVQSFSRLLESKILFCCWTFSLLVSIAILWKFISVWRVTHAFPTLKSKTY